MRVDTVKKKKKIIKIMEFFTQKNGILAQIVHFLILL